MSGSFEVGLLPRILVVTGHYGSGKTNLSVNLAVDLRRQGREVVLADLDIVNPYFRSADFRGLARQHGFELLAPTFANTNLDIPALTGHLDGRIGGEATLIIDVGGDDAGALALGRYAARIREQGYTMLYVINAYRPLTGEPREAADLLGEIEGASRLRATHLVNNSNLAAETTWEDVERSVPYGEETAELCGIPLGCTAIRRDLWSPDREDGRLYPVDIYVKALWD